MLLLDLLIPPGRFLDFVESSYTLQFKEPLSGYEPVETDALQELI